MISVPCTVAFCSIPYRNKSRLDTAHFEEQLYNSTVIRGKNKSDKGRLVAHLLNNGKNGIVRKWRKR